MAGKNFPLEDAVQSLLENNHSGNPLPDFDLGNIFQEVVGSVIDELTDDSGKRKSTAKKENPEILPGILSIKKSRATISKITQSSASPKKRNYQASSEKTTSKATSASKKTKASSAAENTASKIGRPKKKTDDILN